MRRFSIRLRITAISVMAILAAILGIFALSAPRILKETERRSVESMRLIGESTSRRLDDYFVGIERSVGLVASMAANSLDSVLLVECGAAGKSAKQGDPRSRKQVERLDAYIREHCLQVREGLSTAAGRANGVTAYYYCISPGISKSIHGFFFSRVGRAGFIEREPLNACTLDPSDTEHNGWYYEPAARGVPCWVGPFTWAYPEEISICSYVMPIYGAGSLIGILGMDIPVKTLTEQVSPIRIFESGFASLYDREGHVLFHPKEAEGTAPEQAGLPAVGELLKKDTSGDELIRYTKDGKEMQTVFFTLRNGMKLHLTVPEEEVNASWLRLVNHVLIVSVLAVLISALFIRLAMGIITRPLEQLTDASSKLANGDYEVALAYDGRDEIGSLTKAFARMRGQLKLNIEDLNRRAYTDALTGLPNMRSFFSLAVIESRHLKEQGEEPAILFFDLVGMKHYNRQYGFGEGDQLLFEVGQILALHFGERCVCRFSEDHFAAVTRASSYGAMLPEIFAECEKANRGNALPVHAGVYESSLQEAGIPIACDRAKYVCEKNRGSYHSEYYVFDSRMISELETVQYIIGSLDTALMERWIRVYYQPIVDAASGRLCDEEALSRWIDPGRGMISPGDFIPILEKARLIHRLDLYVVDEVLKKMKRQMALNLPAVPHSVNLSRADFDSCDIAEEIRRRVDSAGIPRSMISIEVTESIVGREYDFMKKQIGRFREMGFPVWMDDFGSGYSSLDVLAELSFDLIKFDMHFLHGFEETPESRIILANLIRMTKELGISSLCEGVESGEEVLFLRENGCSRLQGYYFSKPLPCEEILLRQREGELWDFSLPPLEGAGREK